MYKKFVKRSRGNRLKRNHNNNIRWGRNVRWSRNRFRTWRKCTILLENLNSSKVNCFLYFMKITFALLFLRCGQTSASDYLEVSNFMTVDRKLPRYCGQLKDLKMESDGSFFRVTFKSNDRFDGTGFFAHYQFTPVADAVTITRRRSSATNNHPGKHKKN